MKKSSNHSNKALRLAGILLCLVLVSTYWTSGLFARYSSVNEVQDDARVAAFVFDVNDEKTSFTIPVEQNQPGANISYAFIVTNKNENGKISEVAQEYTVTVQLDGSLPLVCTLKDNEKQTKVSFDALGENQTYPLEQSFTESMLAAVETSDRYDLLIDWPTEDEERMDPKYMGGVAEIEIKIVAAQID